MSEGNSRNKSINPTLRNQVTVNGSAESVVGSKFDRRSFVAGSAAVAAVAATQSCKTSPVPEGKPSGFVKHDSPPNLSSVGGIADSSGDIGSKAYDVVVIGSGYGGAVTAARLAQSNKFNRPYGGSVGKTSICVLERGLERLPDHYLDGKENKANRNWLQFPEKPLELLRNMWTPANPFGMIRFYTGTAGNYSSGVDALTGNGLGGTSLINASIAIEPDSDLFQSTVAAGSKNDTAKWKPGKTSIWPKEFQNLNLKSCQIYSSGQRVNYFQKARDTLGVSKLKDMLKSTDTPETVKNQWGLGKNDDFEVQKYSIFRDSVKKIEDEGVGIVYADTTAIDNTPILKMNDLDMCVNTKETDQGGKSFKENSHGFKQRLCTHCGDCMNGCRHGAKNTMQTNYLPIAKKNGAEIYTAIDVRYIKKEKIDGEKEFGYRVFYTYLKNNQRHPEITGSILARNVVVSCGTMGSNELMLRSANMSKQSDQEVHTYITKANYSNSNSNKGDFKIEPHRQKKIEISGTAGKRFSGNGDMLYIAFNSSDPSIVSKGVNQTGIPYEAFHSVDGLKGISPVGPCITAAADYKYMLKEKYHRYLLEDASIYGGLTEILGLLLPVLSDMAGSPVNRQSNESLSDLIASVAGKNWSDFGDAKLLNAARDKMRKTFFFLGMGHDSSDGQLKLASNGTVYGNFAHARSSGPYLDMSKKMAKHLEYLDFEKMGTAKEWIGRTTQKEMVKNNPKSLIEKSLSNLITVHPLGGMTMADNIEKGVVNHKGQVFNGKRQSDLDVVHNGLYIADGSIIPMSVGVNPFLTITAISERNADYMIADRIKGFI